MDTERVGMAVRVIGAAVLRGLVIDEHKSVRIYGRTLDVRELMWLIDGMGGIAETRPPNAPHAEAVEIAGTILGRVYRLVLTERRYGELLNARIDALTPACS